MNICQSRACTRVHKERAAVQLMIVSNRTSKQWLLERNAALPGQKIHILATNIKAPPELKTLLQTQWIDFRNQREKVLQAFATQLADPKNSNISYATDRNYITDRNFLLLVDVLKK